MPRPDNAVEIALMEKIDTLVVDKTGTLTEGKPSVVAIRTAPGIDEIELLRLTASLERSSAAFENTSET